MDDADKHWTTFQGRKPSKESKMQDEHSNSIRLPGKSSKFATLMRVFGQVQEWESLLLLEKKGRR